MLLTLPSGCAPDARSVPPESAEYVLQPGDRIAVRHALDNQFDVVATIAPDGRIAAPGVQEPVTAAGQTLSGLSDRLDRGYRRSGMLKAPSFTVSLQALGSAQAYVGGEVKRPGPVDLPGSSLTAMQAIVSSGGPLPTARLNEVVILRVGADGHMRLLSADLERVLSRGDLAQNVPIQARDVVFVPKSAIAEFDRMVDQYVRQATPVPASLALYFSNAAFIPH